MDFNIFKVDKYRVYGGINGNKISVIINDEAYMLKFPSRSKLNPNMSYTNSTISEHVCCKILQSLGINVQETILGWYKLPNMEKKLVVACKDFVEPGYVLQEFYKIKNAHLEGSSEGAGTELSEIIDTIRTQNLIDPIILNDFFWDMFVADALIGNFDRHNGNWGLLINLEDAKVKIAPIFDCGSSLYPQILIEDMPAIINSQSEIDKRIFVYPTSAIKKDGVKINYFSFISSLKNPDCIKALLRLHKKIDLDKIYQIIDETPYVDPIHKRFFKLMITERKKKIIDFSVNKVNQLLRELKVNLL